MGKSGGAARKAARSTPASTRPAAPSRHSPGMTRALKDIEHSIVHEKVEHAHILAADGSTIFTKKGRKSVVEFTTDELARMRGATLTHNHPAVDVSFSPHDVRLAIQQQLTEMRAVSPSYRYSVRAPEKGWPRKWDGATKMLYGLYHSAELRKARSAMLDGRMTIEEANATVLHNVWTRMHEAGLIHYEREPWNSGVTPGMIPQRRPRNRTPGGQ